MREREREREREGERGREREKERKRERNSTGEKPVPKKRESARNTKFEGSIRYVCFVVIWISIGKRSLVHLAVVKCMECVSKLYISTGYLDVAMMLLRATV